MRNQTGQIAPPYRMIIGVGTEGNQTVRKLLRIAERRGTPIKHGENARVILLDDHFSETRDMEGSPIQGYSPSDIAAMLLTTRLVDKESRRLQNESGELGFLSKHEVEHPGVCEDGFGMGNQPKWGKAMVRMNRRPIEQKIVQGFSGFRDYGRHQEQAVKGEGVASDHKLHVLVFFSPVGGYGSGALFELLRMVKDCSITMHIPVKIHLMMIDLGTFYPPNREITIENRNRLLNRLRAEATGAYRDLEGRNGASDGPLFDTLTVLSNAGPNSQFGTLDHQEWMIADQAYERFFSPLSSRYIEDAVDVDAHVERDGTGAPRIASAPGISRIAMCHETHLEYCEQKAVASFADAVLKSPDEDAASRALRAATETGLVERYSEAHTLRHLTQAAGNQPDLFQEAGGAFCDRVTGLTGVPAMQAALASHDWVTGELTPQIQRPRMVQRAAEIVEAYRERIDDERAACAHDLGGAHRMRLWLEAAGQDLVESEKVNADRLADVIQHKESVLQKIDICRKRTQAYARMGPLGRLLSFFLIRITARRLKSLASQAVSLEVERTARTVAQEQVFPPARKLTADTLEHFVRLENKIEGIVGDAVRGADGILKAKPTPDQVPVGIGLADPVSLKRFYDGEVAEKGGEAKLVEMMRMAVANNHMTFLAILEQPKEVLAHDLREAAAKLFEPKVMTLNVLEAFRARYGNSISNILHQAVLNSGPWICATGEAGLDIPTVKLLGIPMNCNEKWLVEEIKKVDHSGAKDWEVVRLPDAHADIIFLTYRANVSLTMLIAQQVSTRGKADLEWRVHNAADPLAAVLPDGELTEQEARVVACHACSVGLLTRHKDDGWVLNAVNGEFKPLGQEPDAVLSFFKNTFVEVVHVYSALGGALRVNGTAFYDKLRGTENDWDKDEKVRDLVDQQAIRRALKEVRVLLPFVKAIGRKASGG